MHAQNVEAGFLKQTPHNLFRCKAQMVGQKEWPIVFSCQKIRCISRFQQKLSSYFHAPLQEQQELRWTGQMRVDVQNGHHVVLLIVRREVEVADIQPTSNQVRFLSINSV